MQVNDNELNNRLIAICYELEFGHLEDADEQLKELLADLEDA